MGDKACLEKELSTFLHAGKILLAPMVRIGTLPFRLQCLRYGADLVYSEEIIDIKLLKTKRIENEILKTIEYVLDDGTVVYQTCEEERGKNVLQIGSSSAERAALAVKHVSTDVAVIDLNMGCPKPFSLKGGMGAALLRDKEKVKNILEAMVKNSSVPVTCKIRVLPNMEDALQIADIAQSVGVTAIGVHGRTPYEAPNTPNKEHAIEKVAKHVTIPVIANGGSLVVGSRKEAEEFRKRAGASSAMLARAALENPSVFSEELKPMQEVVPEFLKLAALYDMPSHLVKYTLAQMIGSWNPRTSAPESDVPELEITRQKWLDAAISSSNLSEMLPVFGFSESFISEYNLRHTQVAEMWRVRSVGDGVICMTVDDDAKSMMISGGDSPKELLASFCQRRNLSVPVYESTEREDRRFYSLVAIDGQKFTSGRIEQRKRVGEQAAAMAALVYLDAFT